MKKTRSERNREVDRFELYKPFIFYTLVLMGLNAAVIMTGGGPSVLVGAALLCGGLLSWGLIEYSIHRWVLHRVPGRGLDLPGNRTHLTHHENPHALDRLNVQLAESLPVCAAYCLLAWALTGDWRAVVYLYTGLMAGYFFYEYLDFQAHHGTSRGRLTRYFRRYHLQHHHFDARVRFGVTSPLFDYIFGTFHLERRAGLVKRYDGGRS